MALPSCCNHNHCAACRSRRENITSNVCPYVTEHTHKIPNNMCNLQFHISYIHVLTRKNVDPKSCIYIEWHKKTGTFEKPNKNLRNPRKKIIDRNWTITTCLLRDSNPNYQCLKITSCRWPLLHVCILSLPLRISKVPVLLCHSVCVTRSAECDSVAFCRACNTHRVTQKNGNFWNAQWPWKNA